MAFYSCSLEKTVKYRHCEAFAVISSMWTCHARSHDIITRRRVQFACPIRLSFIVIGDMSACLPFLPLPLPHFIYPQPFPSSLSFYTHFPPYVHPPHLYNPPLNPVMPQFGSVMGICTFDTNSEATCVIQGSLALSLRNTCHSSLSV